MDIPYEAKIRVLMVSLCIGSYGVLSNTLILFRRSRLVLMWVLIFALLCSFYGLINFFKQPDMVLWVERHFVYEGRLASTYICPNHFGHLLQMLMSFCLVLLFIPQAGLSLRLLAGYCLLAFPVTIYFTESRASILGMIAALGVTILLMSLRKNKKLFFILLIAIPLSTAVLLGGAWKYSEMFNRRMTPVVKFVAGIASEGFADAPVNDFRPKTWLDTLDMIKEKPLVGFGPGSYHFAFPEFRKRFSGARIISGHPHNEYLEIASEYGLIGLGLFAFAWGYGLIRILIFSLKTDQQHHAFMAMAFIGTAVGTMVHSFFDFEMNEFQNAMVFSLLAAIAVGPICGRKLDALKNRALFRYRLSSWVFAGISLIALVLSVGTFSSAFLRAMADRAFESKSIDSSIPLYLAAIRMDSSNWKAYRGLGELYAQERRYTLEKELKAELGELQKSFLEKGLEFNPLSPRIALSLGRINVALGEQAEGLEMLKKITVMRPFNDQYWWFYGLELRKAGHYEDALAVFRQAHRIKRSVTVKKNIQWLERKLKKGPLPEKKEEAVQRPGLVMPKFDLGEGAADESLDSLFELMESN
ncbi:MAG: O-antigen ligase family protein [Pontiella sp.]